jgi:hypothetical protein
MELTADIVLVTVAALGAAVCVLGLADRLPARAGVFESALGLRQRTDRVPTQLIRVQQTVVWSTASGVDVHGRLRPVLVDIAEARLGRRGLRLDRDAGEARRLLGPAAWEIVRPDRPVPTDPDAPGISPRELERIFDALEAV